MGPIGDLNGELKKAGTAVPKLTNAIAKLTNQLAEAPAKNVVKYEFTSHEVISHEVISQEIVSQEFVSHLAVPLLPLPYVGEDEILVIDSFRLVGDVPLLNP